MYCRSASGSHDSVLVRTHHDDPANFIFFVQFYHLAICCARCLAAGHTAAAKLADHLKVLLPAANASAEAGAPGAATAEGALLLARLATALEADTLALQVRLDESCRVGFDKHCESQDFRG